MAPNQKAAELAAEARYAADRVSLYQQRVFAGRADGKRLAELQRVAAGAASRAARAGDVRAPAKPDMTLEEALTDVALKLNAPDLDNRSRKLLLQRQAELGDLRDELAVRARRQAIAQHAAVPARR
jgi:hypothetical protein